MDFWWGSSKQFFHIKGAKTIKVNDASVAPGCQLESVHNVFYI